MLTQECIYNYYNSEYENLIYSGKLQPKNLISFYDFAKDIQDKNLQTKTSINDFLNYKKNVENILFEIPDKNTLYFCRDYIWVVPFYRKISFKSVQNNNKKIVQYFIKKFFDKQQIDAADVIRTFNTQLTQTQTIGYKISAIVDGDNYKNWYVPCDSLDKKTLIDSQIIFNKIYSYEISEIILKVEDTTFSLEEKSLGTSTFKWEAYSPLPPQIEFVPFSGESKKFNILINENTGYDMMTPVFLSKEEENNFSTNIEGGKALYKQTPYKKYFEIWRTDKQPKSYKDFELFKDNLEALGTSAVFQESVDQNKKYYYFFRTKSVVGNLQNNFPLISNPSEIFTVELVNDSGSIYPLFGEYDMGKISVDESVQPTKLLKQFLSISPAISQIIYDNQTYNASNPNNIQVGIKGIDGMWDKKFKIRLTSKTSGRKIDFNLQFKKNQNQG